MLVLMLRVNDIIFICMDEDYTYGVSKNQKRGEDPERKRQGGEDGAGYGFSLAIGIGPVPSILKGTIVEEL